MDFFIADTHFFDESIIRYENRPFADTENMLQELIKGWNETVGDDDRVFVLGDWLDVTRVKSRSCDITVFQKLRGKKFLIRGNHDMESDEFYKACGFIKIYEYPIILENFWILSHEPLYVNNNMPYANIYGHIHGSDMYKDYSPHSYCVSAERIGYSPISFEAVKRAVMSCAES